MNLRGTVLDPNLKDVVVRLEQQVLTATIDTGGGSWAVSVPVTAEGPHRMVIDAADSLEHHALVPLSLVIDRTQPSIVVSEGGLPFRATAIPRPLSLIVGVTDAGGVTAVSATLDGVPYQSGTVIETGRMNWGRSFCSLVFSRISFGATLSQLSGRARFE